MSKNERWLLVIVLVLLVIIGVAAVRAVMTGSHRLAVARLVTINPPSAFYPGSPWTYTFDDGTRVAGPSSVTSGASVNVTYSVDSQQGFFDATPTVVIQQTTTSSP